MISIIVPVYNCEKYLDQCVQSILNQSYKDWELILIDDGSTDSSSRIIDKYTSLYSKINKKHLENGGLSYARNKGIELAKGEFITFVDSDDLLLEDSLAKLMDASLNSDADLVEGKFLYGKNFTKSKRNNQYKTITYSPIEAIENALYQKTLLPSACGKLFKRHLLENNRFTEGLYYEDLDFFYKIFLRCNKIVYIDTPVYFYRETPGSILHRWDKHRLDVLNVTQDLENYIAEKTPQLLPAAKDRRLSANFNIFILSTINSENNIADHCWNYIIVNRKKSLFNIKVRFKNKAGILVSFLGRRFFSKMLTIFYKNAL